MALPNTAAPTSKEAVIPPPSRLAATSNTAAVTEAAPILSLNNIEVVYDHVILVLKGVSLQVSAGEIVALLGANGAGKSTTLKAISNLLSAERGEVTKGSIIFDGAQVHALSPSELVRRGCIQVMEGRHCFAHLSVEENLLIGKYGRAVEGPWSLNAIYDLFPVLKDRRNSPSTALSGGQQQMVAIGRALMSNPRVLLCDEISLGLAPVVVREVYARLPSIVAEGSSLLIVEQDIVQALKAANHVYCLQEGRIALAGAAATLTREAISAAYFGA